MKNKNILHKSKTVGKTEFNFGDNVSYLFVESKFHDISQLAIWIAENFFHKHGYIWYRAKKNQIYLCPEERTLIVLFIETLFWQFLKNGQITFEVEWILGDLCALLGMHGYEKSTDINICCRAFAEKIPLFIEKIKEGNENVDIRY